MKLSIVLLSDDKTVDTPLWTNVKHREVDGEQLSDPTGYRHTIDQLVYLWIFGPDISHVVALLASLLMHFTLRTMQPFCGFLSVFVIMITTHLCQTLSLLSMSL